MTVCSRSSKPIPELVLPGFELRARPSESESEPLSRGGGSGGQRGGAELLVGGLGYVGYQLPS